MTDPSQGTRSTPSSSSISPAQGHGRRPGRRPRRLIAAALGLVLSLFVALGLAEGGVRALMALGLRVDLAPFQIQGTRCFLAYHPVRAWQNLPSSSQTCREALVTIGRHGFRGPEFSVEKKPGVFRILVLGDSFTWGWGVDQTETFPHQLEESLRRKLGAERPVEVLNAGVSGYGTVQELLTLREWGSRLAPDLVVLFYYRNDFRDNVVGFEYGYPKPTYVDVEKVDQGIEPRVPQVVAGDHTFYRLRERPWLSGLALYRTLLSRAQADFGLARAFARVGLLRLEDIGLHPEASAMPAGTDAGEVSARMIQAVVDRASALGARTLVAVNANSDNFTDEIFAEGLDPEWLPARLVRRGIVPLDVFEEVRARHLTRDRLCHSNGEHYNAFGNRIMAQLIETELEKRGWLPAADVQRAAVDGAREATPASERKPCATREIWRRRVLSASDEATREWLAGCATHGSWSQRFAAISSLPPVRPEPGRELLDAMHSRRWYLREAAARVLVSMGSRSTASLVRALTDSDPSVRALAARSLGEAGLPGLEVKAALEVATIDPDRVVARDATRALQRLAASRPVPGAGDEPSSPDREEAR